MVGARDARPFGIVTAGWTDSRADRGHHMAGLRVPAPARDAPGQVVGGPSMDHQPQADSDGRAAGWGGSDLAVEVSSDTTRSRIRLAGELDICTIPRLELALQRVRRDGHRVVELDVGGLVFLCVSALQVLVDAHTALRDAGGRLVLLNSGRRVRRILELTGLDDVLETAQAPDDAPDRGARGTRLGAAAD